jgi:hypothetical protein
MAETTSIRRGLIRECQDRNDSGAQPNDGVFFIHKHLLGHLDACAKKMFNARIIGKYACQENTEL